jgi:hypothetical protein
VRRDAKFICDGEWDVEQDRIPLWTPEQSDEDFSGTGMDRVDAFSYYAVRISVVTFILFLIWLWVTS